MLYRTITPSTRSQKHTVIENFLVLIVTSIKTRCTRFIRYAVPIRCTRLKRYCPQERYGKAQEFQISINDGISLTKQRAPLKCIFTNVDKLSSSTAITSNFDGTVKLGYIGLVISDNGIISD